MPVYSVQVRQYIQCSEDITVYIYTDGDVDKDVIIQAIHNSDISNLEGWERDGDGDVMDYECDEDTIHIVEGSCEFNLILTKNENGNPDIREISPISSDRILDREHGDFTLIDALMLFKKKQ